MLQESRSKCIYSERKVEYCACDSFGSIYFHITWTFVKLNGKNGKKREHEKDDNSPLRIEQKFLLQFLRNSCVRMFTSERLQLEL